MTPDTGQAGDLRSHGARAAICWVLVTTVTKTKHVVGGKWQRGLESHLACLTRVLLCCAQALRSGSQ